MFYTLSKLIWFFLQPSALWFWLVLGGVMAWRWGRQRLARRLALTGFIMLLAMAYSPLARLLILPLEDRFPMMTIAESKSEEVDGIIVIGGAVNSAITHGRGTPSLGTSAERLIEAVKLAKAHPKARIFLTGGPNSITGKEGADATIIKQLMVHLGLNPARIETETRSRNSWQNARFSKKLAQPKPEENWLLVTSAYQMPRAIGSFRAAGWPVRAFPVDYRTSGKKSRLKTFSYALDGVTLTDIAAKEWLGLLAYWLTGRSNSLFPAPYEGN